MIINRHINNLTLLLLTITSQPASIPQSAVVVDLFFKGMGELELLNHQTYAATYVCT